MAEYGTIINEISTTDGLLHKINADTIDGKHFSDIEAIVAGAAETYVVTSNAEPWTNISASSIQVPLNTLATLAGVSASSIKLGDVILNTISDIPDWWVSASDSTNFTLSVLETQGVNHTHTLPTLSTPTVKISSVKTITSAQVAKVGTGVDVVTGVDTGSASSVYSAGKVIASYTNGSLTGDVSATLVTATSANGFSHTHDLPAHNHTVTYNHVEANATESAITSLSSISINNHTHTSQTVAGAKTDGTAFTYVSGGSKTNVITGLVTATSDSTTGAASTTSTGAGSSHSHNVPANSFISYVAASTGAASGNTESAGSDTGYVTALSTTEYNTGSATHTHTLTNASTESVVKSFSVNGTSNGGSKYLTNVTASAVSSFSTSVNGDGVLSFSAPVANVASLTTSYMHFSSGAASVSGTISGDGAHTHNMNHKHTVNAHSHGLNSHTHEITSALNSAVVAVTAESGHTHNMAHTHTYKSVVASGNVDAFTALSTTTYTPHTHADNVGVASYVAGTSTSVYNKVSTSATFIKTLKDVSASATVSNASPAIGTTWMSISVSNTLAQGADTITWAPLKTSNITPAAAGLSVVTSIVTEEKNPIQSVTYSTIGTDKTGGKTTV